MLAINIIGFVSVPLAILGLVSLAVGWLTIAGIGFLLFFLSSQIAMPIIFIEELQMEENSRGAP